MDNTDKVKQRRSKDTASIMVTALDAQLGCLPFLNRSLVSLSCENPSVYYKTFLLSLYVYYNSILTVCLPILSTLLFCVMLFMFVT